MVINAEGLTPERFAPGTAELHRSFELCIPGHETTWWHKLLEDSVRTGKRM